ncbi:MAG TPA: hypothetical protein VH370_25435 [Humisphaera sp.]|jgi:hypothetical protein|nr:hypothetical protein [Humisphaera sp.]
MPTLNDAQLPRLPHPIVWTILYTPFGALGGFVGVALAFRATKHGLSITEGLLSGLITAIGCFLGGWVCKQMNARMAYAACGIALAFIAAGMAASPHTVSMYVAWNMIYALGVGLSFAAFTAMVLLALGRSAAATAYNVFASLSNFPAWWLGLLLGRTADLHGPRMMLLTEAALGVVGVVVFVAIDRLLARQMKEPEVVIA